MSEPLSEEQLRYYGEIRDYLKSVRSETTGASEALSLFGRFSWDNRVDAAIDSLLGEVERLKAERADILARLKEIWYEPNGHDGNQMLLRVLAMFREDRP